MPEPANRPTKRMRLGTRSCAECRRRKVRCKFPEGDTVCEECKAHGTTCRSQQASLETKTGNADLLDSDSDVRQRLETLERLFAQVRSSIESSGSASPDSLRLDVAQLLRPTASPSLDSTEGTSQNGLVHDGSTLPPSQSIVLEAPLLKLFKDALVMEPQAQFIAPASYAGHQRVAAAAARLKYVLPDQTLLTNILQVSQPYWFLWPLPPGRGTDPIADASARILQGLRSNKPTVFAKSLLWFCLCLQQLVGDNRRLIAGFQTTHGELQERYFVEAVDVLPHEFEADELRDGMECLLLQTKLYVDLGRPHRVWQAAGSAIKTGLLLGLDKQNNPDAEGRALFQAAWKLERTICHSVGLPPSISEHDPALNAQIDSDIWQSRVLRGLALVSGHIAERDRHGAFPDYSRTESIESELQHLYSSIPPGAWLENLPPGLPVQQVFGQNYIELMLHCHRKNAHMPFIFTANQDPRYARSRIIALESARRVCATVRDFRKRTQGWIMACDLADFQVFTGAATLALGLFLPTAPGEIRDQEADWQLVECVIAHLRQNHRSAHCAVAGQAADLLEHLSLAKHGLLPPDKDYHAAIPYFGRFHIRRRPEQIATGGSQNVVTAQGEKAMAHIDYSIGNSVEFYSDVLQGIDSMYWSPELLGDVDFGTDWLSGVEFETGNDWIQLLGQSGSY